MESTEELQKLEITALKSIYDGYFLESPPPKVWKGAIRLPEFIIRVPHPDETHAPNVYFHLHTKFPKTYPTLACPIFTIQKPIQGFSQDLVTRLSNAIHNESQRNKGSEMVFQIITYAQEWIATQVVPSKEASGSLATEMNRRAQDEEEARRIQEIAEAEEKQEQEAREAAQLQQEIITNAQRQQLAKDQQYRARRRAESDATEVPSAGDTPTETFSEELEVDGIRFNTVKIFHPRREGLGTTYLADPVCDDVHATLPLELFVIVFTSSYYAAAQGRKKLKQLSEEIQRLTAIRHPNILSIFAVKLSLPHSSGPPRLALLSEQRPALTLQDVLEDCDSLREERASDYLAQILSGLNALHNVELVHRGLNLRCIGLATRDHSTPSKLIKIGKVGYHTRLLDLHRSNTFGSHIGQVQDEPRIPDNWLLREAVENPLTYNKIRDIHSVGIVLLQMISGHDALDRFTDVHSALRSSPVSDILQQHAITMLLPNRKQLSCSSLLAEIVGVPHRAASRSPTVPINGQRTPAAVNYGGSPEMDYFNLAYKTRQASRWKEDWDELELLGKGAFGSVVKARNKIDSRIYAVKKVRLRAAQSDNKIFREVNALSRLSHRFIVRYYTTWVETSESVSHAPSPNDSSSEGTEGGMTSVPHSQSTSRHTFSNGTDSITVDLNDLDSYSSGRTSFPSIHFGGSAGSQESSSSDDSDDLANLLQVAPDTPGRLRIVTPPPPITRTLYIQMEFVERQTLRERVDEGLSEDEAWRLFQQILDALVHMSGLGILHRDIKLTNIFIDGRGDCKVGDFGLATSSLAAVDPSDVSPHLTPLDSDMTLEVGTRLYIAPEVQARTRKRGPRNHNKADIYSLGIVFFEMNFAFATASERIAVIEDLRKPDIFFPAGWEPHLTRQREIITRLLQHDPTNRPTALELSQSPLLPARLEDEYFKGALKMIAKQDSPHQQAIIASLFNQPPKPVRAFLYDLEAELPEHAALNDVVQQGLTSIFRLHGAVDMEPPLLMPSLRPEDQADQATFLDRHGEVVSLPNNALVPFARLAARANSLRIKRYHISDIYRPNDVSGHPKVTKAAVFDMITPDLDTGPIATAAELLAVVDDCLNKFPNINQNYEIHISHSRIVDLALNRINPDLRNSVMDILTQSKSSASQKRALLLKKGLLRSTADELEILAETDNDIDAVTAKLEKVSPSLLTIMTPVIEQIRKTIQYANCAGFSRPIMVHPLMVGSHHAHFKEGVRFEVVRKTRRMDVLAAGGRYDNLIAQYSPPKAGSKGVCAFGVQIALEKITVALAAYQSSSIKTLVKEQRSFGFWSPRRCDVYIVSYQPGFLQERLEIAALLWKHNISADVMYEFGLSDSEHETHLETCAREGILFAIYTRPRAARTAFKVKSVLKGTESEVSRQELVSWLHQQITEQKRIDVSTSGAPAFTEILQPSTTHKDLPTSSETQLILPGDTKKLRKQTKQMFLDRAFEVAGQVKSAVQNGIPTIGLDVPISVFEAMTRSPTWITDEEAWKAILAAFPTSHSGYAYQVRDSVAKRKAEGYQYILLFAVREERVRLLTLS